jgi:ribosomal protein L37AE/L43A
VHGVLRNGGLAAAPLCFNCHGAHDVAVASAGVGRRDVCLGCHTEAAASHETWLPNVELHFGVVSCPVCHTPNAQRMVNLILYNSVTQKEISGPAGIPEFQTPAGSTTATPQGLDPTTLMTLLTTLNNQDVAGKTGIRGRLEVRTGVEDHELTFAAKAISNCDTCHRKGAAAFQSVAISVAGPAGIPIHYDANKDVLSSALSLNSMGGFYAIGGSRITFLDVLFVLALFVGIGWSVVHMIARWAIRRYLPPPPHGQHKG